MSRTFAYCRVSTTEQTTEHQKQAIKARGYDVVDSRVLSDEGVSGSVAAMQRPEFKKLVDRIEAGDKLIVLKLDRLGRDNIDVQNTVSMLIEKGVEVHCLDLPVANLSSAEGRFTLQMFASFAEFERNRIRERTQEAIASRRAQGLPVGRPIATDTTKAVQDCKENGLTQAQTAEKLNVSIRTVKYHWKR